MKNQTTLNLALALGLTTAAVSAQAQDAGALVDALVRKGVLSTQEAEEVRADMTRDFAATPAGKINLSNSITELKLSGDLRLRYQYDNKDPQINPGAALGADSASGDQRSRFRFRLRLNADFRLTENFSGGVELQTGQASDSANQTFENGFSDYNIYISKAFLNWTPNDWLSVSGGKIANPFYTTDLVWDADINPTGAAEVLAFHKMDLGGGHDTAKPVHDWELSLVAGQFLFDDNNEGDGTDNDATTDAYLFETQLVAAYKFSSDVKLTVAPAWLTYVNGAAKDLINENKFEDTALVSGATRNLSLILVPGDLSFKLGGLKAKFYWDFSYNLDGRKRVEDTYGLAGPAGPGRVSQYSDDDSLAYLAGFQLGENKKKGDWSALANWRSTGIGAVDPNLNDSDFALGELNTRGFKAGVAYNFTDFCVGAVTYMQAWNLRGDLIGGQATTKPNAIADSNGVQVLQVDLNVKF